MAHDFAERLRYWTVAGPRDDVWLGRTVVALVVAFASIFLWDSGSVCALLLVAMCVIRWFRASKKSGNASHRRVPVTGKRRS